jgi:hypothetical protein
MATSEFGKAFAAARKGGEKEFTFNGKRYNTRTADEEAASKKAASDAGMRKKSDMVVALTKAERDAPSDANRKVVSEAKRKAVEDYGTAKLAEGMKSYGSRSRNSPVVPKTTVSEPPRKKPYMPEEPPMHYKGYANVGKNK